MRKKPNILIQRNYDTKFEYLKYLAEENIQPIVDKTKIKTSTIVKQKPNIKIQKRNIKNINKFRIDILNWANRELGIHPDLLVEYDDKYKLTITSYRFNLYGVENISGKDFDIYCNGLAVANEDVSVGFISSNKIELYINKSEAVDDNFDTTNFEIVSKLDYVYLGAGDVNLDGEEDWLDTEDYNDIIV